MSKMNFQDVFSANQEVAEKKRSMTQSLKAEMREAIKLHNEQGGNGSGQDVPEKEIELLLANKMTTDFSENIQLRKNIKDLYCQATYGTDFKGMLDIMGVSTSFQKVKENCEKLGLGSNLTSNQFSSIITEGGTFKPFRWAIRELILSPVTDGYAASVGYPNWISGVVPVTSSGNNYVPKMLYTPNAPKHLVEGETISIGTMKIGQKTVSVRKYGNAMEFTTESILSASFDALQQGFQEIGTQMARTADALAVDVILNGEQTDGSEAIAQVGVYTPNSWTRKDFIYMMETFKNINRLPNVMISELGVGVDIKQILPYTPSGNDIDPLMTEMFNGLLKNSYAREQMGSLLAVFLDSRSAIGQLMFGTMTLETDRNAANDTTLLFVREHIGFYVQQRDARVALKKDANIASVPYPEYMNAQKLLNVTSF